MSLAIRDRCNKNIEFVVYNLFVLDCCFIRQQVQVLMLRVNNEDKGKAKYAKVSLAMRRTTAVL